MPAPAEETRVQPIGALCPGCFHPRHWDAATECPICRYRPNATRSAVLLPVGTPLQRYAIGEKLGQGGFGITYRGLDLQLRMKVAIKEYYPSALVTRATDRKTLAMNTPEHAEVFAYGLTTFLQEARTLAQIRHAHVVRVLNYFEMNRTAYLVMDYYAGEDLSAYLQKQPGSRMPWRAAVALLLPVLDGLHRVHQAGFMHRDLKPGNLYLTADGLILLDFGSARQVSGSHTRSMLVFSEGYAPCEQTLASDLQRQGPWTDVYGAAATLYRMLTGQRLPSGLDRKHRLLDRKTDLLAPARQWAPEVPPALDDVLQHALAVEPEQRLQSAAEFKRQLETVVAAAEERPVTPAAKWGKDSGWWTKPRVRAVEFAALMTGLTWIGLWFSGHLDSEPTPLARHPTASVATTSPVIEPALPPVATTPPVRVEHQSGDVLPPDRLQDGSAEPALVLIKGGCFQMGSPKTEVGRDSDERQHRVCVEAFEIGQYEVTQGQWQAVMGDNPSAFNSGDHYPVESVSWDDIQTYLEKLNQQTGQQYRLPTEAEWEYACRGGVEGQRYCGGDDVDRVAWYRENSDGRTHPVGQKAANGYGLYDMSGNVWEWTCSVYMENYDGAERRCANHDATGRLAVRGGSWNFLPVWVRSAFRTWVDPASRLNLRGFRLARSL